MQCYTELTPPTAVTHSLSLPFLAADTTNLIVAKTSLLQIFALKTTSREVDDTEKEQGNPTNGDRQEAGRAGGDDGFESSYLVPDSLIARAEPVQTTKLVLLAEYALSGTVTSMVRIKTAASKSGGDSLLLAFRDAKLSLVEWDPDRNGLATVSIHYYEQEDIDGSPWAPKLSNCVNYVIADPESRCAALRFGARNLAILPFQEGDEDIAMDDWDEELDGPRPGPTQGLVNGASSQRERPYASSFVLRMSSLDPSIIYPVHLAFLYEYRDPTFGILSSTVSPSASLLHERKDSLSYMVFTLDLQQKASTTILVVNNLPLDLFKVIAVPTPVGGSLLVGENELIHIDQSGKSNGVAVNAFAKHSTSYGLADQSDLEMRLESSSIEPLSTGNGDMLIVLSSGIFAILIFKMDGRSVSGLSVRYLEGENTEELVLGTPSSISSLGRNRIFVSCEEADSVLIGWSRKTKDATRRRAPGPDAEDDSEIEDIEDVDDDDLYGDAPVVLQASAEGREDSTQSKAGEYTFKVHENLVNIGPLRDIALSRPSKSAVGADAESSDSISGDLELVAASGRNRSGGITILNREIEPKLIGRFDFPEARGAWTMSAQKPLTKSLLPSADDSVGQDGQFDRLMIVSKTSQDDGEESAVYALTDTGFEALAGTEFDPAAGATIEAGTLGKGMRIVQVLRSEVRSYDGDLGLAQIVPMFDDETDAEPKIISASIVDPFLLLVRDDASIFVAHCDSENELEEIEREDDRLLANKWLSGSLYKDISGVFAAQSTDKNLKYGEEVVMCLLNADGALFMYSLPDLSQPIYVAHGLCFIPPTLSPDYAARRSSSRETLTEILLADLGDSCSRKPYLTLRSANDDLTIYEPYRIPSRAVPLPLSKALYFLKAPNPRIAKDPEASAQEEEERSNAGAKPRDLPMRAIKNIGGFSVVFMPGNSPSFVIKSSASLPRVIRLRGKGVRDLSAFHTAGCDHGFIYLDSDGVMRVSQLPLDTDFTTVGMPLRKICFGEDVQTVAYQPVEDVYILGTTSSEAFELPKDDDYHHEWQKEDITFKPLMERSSVKLLSPKTWDFVGTVDLDPGEVIMCMKMLNLEVSETTHERKPLVAIGTAVNQGEDLAVKGRIYVFDVVTVVPEPGRPETNKKLKLIAKEEIPRGAVTGLSEIGKQGFLLCAQGQKCMVRGLKEDGSLLPVAFLDVSTYVTSVAALPGTGFCVLGDAIKGAWLAGYAEDPYKMLLFGKQAHDMEVVNVGIFPIGKDLYIVVADSDCNLHLLQFDPEHPKSIQGQVLLQRTTFALGGHIPTTMTLLPSTRAATALKATPDSADIVAEETIPGHEILMTLSSGAIAVLTPLSETVYRRLITLTNLLMNTLYHAAGLNSKAFRISNDAPEAVVGGRAVVDGAILVRWAELGSQRRAEVASRVGVDVEQIREDLSELQSGLGYL